MTPAMLALVLGATAPEVPPDLFRDYARCTHGRERCVARLGELEPRIQDLEEELAEERAREAGVPVVTVILVVVGAAVLAGAAGFAVGFTVAP